MGDAGEGFMRSSAGFVQDFGYLEIDRTGKRVGSSGKTVFNKGELVVVQGRYDLLNRGEHIRENQEDKPGGLHVSLRSFLKHSITRGRGQLQHQSEEYLNFGLSMPLDLDCARFKAAWQTLFAKATDAESEPFVKANPSGVPVPEVKEGMTPAEVEAVLGAPERKASVAGKTIYFYPRMKVTFTGGKVSAIE